MDDITNLLLVKQMMIKKMMMTMMMIRMMILMMIMIRCLAELVPIVEYWIDRG